MTLCVFCTGVGTIYARYKHVELLREDATNVSARLNKAALWLGVISCFGMCIVATFQVCTHIKITFNTSQLIQCNYKWCLFFSFFLIAGNSSANSPWYWSNSVFCLWHCVHYPPVFYIISSPSVWVLQVCVLCAGRYCLPCCCCICTQYPFWVFKCLCDLTLWSW